MRTDIVAINGHRSSAIIGPIINHSKSSSNRPVDGFIKKPAASVRQQIKSNTFHKRTEKAQTLMRGAVKKPAEHFQAKLQKPIDGPNIQRELRAKLATKHPHVDHFGVPKPAVSRPAATETPRQPISGEIVSSGSAQQPVSPAAAPLPSMITSVSHQKLERMLDEALTRADAHKHALHYQAARHFWRRRWLSGSRRWVTMSALLLLIIGGLFLAWQKVPQLSVKIAGMKAHVSPAVPTYKPEGYAMAGPAKAVQGAVTIKYAGSDNSQSYDITQSPSNFTSSMVSQSVVPKGEPVQTSRVDGNTVYIYGSNNDAAWVNNGVLYTLKDRANLDSDQIIKIVQGLNP